MTHDIKETEQDRSVVLFNGSRDTRIHDPSAEYATITPKQIVALCKAPRDKPKADALAIIPSTYRAYNAREHAKQREHGSYPWSCFDIDTGNLTLAEVKAAFQAVFGEETTMLIYSTSGSTADNRKWRVLIPLAQPTRGADYTEQQEALCDLLAEHDLICDRALCRTGQPVFLPNVPPDKRDADGMPLFYQHEIHKGARFNTAASEPLQSRLQARAEVEAASAGHAEIERQKAAQRRAERVKEYGEGTSPVDAFNAANALPDLMLLYGYVHSHKDHWISPNSESKGASVRLYGDRWCSLTQSDAGIGRDGAVGRWGDAFDLYVHYEHGDKYAEAVTAYAREAGLNSQRDVSLDDFDEVPSETSRNAAKPPAPETDPYQQYFAVDSRGNIPFNHHNAMEIITKDEAWRDVFAFDEFSQRKMVMTMPPNVAGNRNFFKPREIKDSDYVDVLRWFNLNGFLRANKATVCDVVDAACMENIISPVKHWLEGLAEKHPKPDMSLLTTWAVTALGTDVETSEKQNYVEAVSQKWLIAAVARAIKPGCKADAVLILEGSQGAGKSTASRILAGDDWFGDALPPMTSKDASDYLRGKWIVELAELSNINKAEVEIVKAFVSRTEERFRPAYGRSEICYPRSCVFVGTTNKTDYLRDDTGNRRFWPIKCGKIDLEWLKEHRDELFAAAVVAFKNGEPWWLNADEDAAARQEQEHRYSEDAWADAIREWVTRENIETTYILEVAEKALEFQTKDVNRTVQNRISSILTELGFTKAAKRGKSGRFRDKTIFTRGMDDLF
ncbi:virulence-associated protein E [Loktanella sp. PT4BL]|jgi:predicted P-loop ATPase|uniref:virulence-associated E family protein n=1 Tax=Loktanella sp. PT4BL TaxID=2135611 RepID=UPI000D753CF4|nr:virulence-associated E family protein [Loktanella sp. PT4BL]PXW70486.1 virulence-associated protein E [Loktanella sp. PT4BL]